MTGRPVLEFPYRERVIMATPEMLGQYPGMAETAVEHAPILDVWLLDADMKRRVCFPALVDTGAPHSLWPATAMADLGIADEDCATGVYETTGSAEGCLEKPGGVDVEFDADGKPYRLNLDAVFHPTLPFALLGRSDFLAAFTLAVRERDQIFALQPVLPVEPAQAEPSPERA